MLSERRKIVGPLLRLVETGGAKHLQSRVYAGPVSSYHPRHLNLKITEVKMTRNLYKKVAYRPRNGQSHKQFLEIILVDSVLMKMGNLLSIT